MSNERPITAATGPTAAPASGGRFRATRRLLCAAGVLAVFFGIVHVAGWAAHTSVLAGVSSSGVSRDACGLIYVALFAAFYIVVPILVIAAGLMALMETGVGRSVGSTNEKPLPDPRQGPSCG
jgi:hypothetical protein